VTIRETGEPGRGARFEIHVPREVYRFTKNPPGFLKTPISLLKFSILATQMLIKKEPSRKFITGMLFLERYNSRRLEGLVIFKEQVSSRCIRPGVFIQPNETKRDLSKKTWKNYSKRILNLRSISGEIRYCPG